MSNEQLVYNGDVNVQCTVSVIIMTCKVKALGGCSWTVRGDQQTCWGRGHIMSAHNRPHSLL